MGLCRQFRQKTCTFIPRQLWSSPSIAEPQNWSGGKEICILPPDQFRGSCMLGRGHSGRGVKVHIVYSTLEHTVRQTNKK